jgi:shikimate 5-dehydrogenase
MEAAMNTTQSEANPQIVSKPELTEDQKLRRLQMMVNMVMQVIAQDGSVSVDDASQMIADTRRAALALFPEKELAYDLIYKPRLQRLMRERYRLQ